MLLYDKSKQMIVLQVIKLSHKTLEAIDLKEFQHNLIFLSGIIPLSSNFDKLSPALVD
jgi:hypothetical protein